MTAFLEDESPPTGSLMPPATTQRRYARPSPLSSEPRIVPPFVARRTAPAPESPRPEEEEMTPSPVTEPVEPEPGSEPARETVPAPLGQAETSDAADAAIEELSARPDDNDHRWEDVPGDQGVVEPAFEADTNAVLEALTQQASELARRDEFPLEAFIVPERSQSFPSGIEPGAAPTPRDDKPITSLAERLEKLSHKLRVEDTDAVVRRLAAGDRLDTLLAGLLAGYLAGTSEKS